MVGNIIPFIGGEEEKSEQEPLRVLGKVENGQIVKAELPKITCQCVRVPVLNGHTAAVFINFEKKPTKEQLIEKLVAFKGFPQEAELPSARSSLSSTLKRITVHRCSRWSSAAFETLTTRIYYKEIKKAGIRNLGIPEKLPWIRGSL